MNDDEPHRANTGSAADAAKRRAIDAVRARLEEIRRHARELDAVDGEPCPAHESGLDPT
jgi:hypothetical protein